MREVIIILTFFALLASLFLPYIIYYLFMKNKAAGKWNLVIDKNYEPKVTLIVASYNESSVIKKKLDNIQQIDYPEDKLQVIIVDSASTDGTLDICRNYVRNSDFRFKDVILLSEEVRMGKSHALNTALEYAKGEIIATSDSDSFWNSDALRKSVSYLADRSVGAITGCERLFNIDRSVHTQSEGTYRKFYYTLRLGESKVDSTFIVQGELSLYRRLAFQKFEDKPGASDDIGTVIGIISRRYRCIFVPEAVFYDTAAYSLRGRMLLKSRRAEHLVAGIFRTLRLKLRGGFPLSTLIIFFNFYLHIACPILLIITAVLFFLYIQQLFPLLLFFIPILLYGKSRIFLVSYLTSNIALLAGLGNHLFGKKKGTWQKVTEMRQQ